MLGSDMNPGKFYSLFKVHKEHKECELPPVGPIISGYGSMFENAGIFVEHHKNNMLQNMHLFYKILLISFDIFRNKPAAQAAGADPSR